MNSNIRGATISLQCSINKSDKIEIDTLNTEITNIEQKLADESISNELAEAKYSLNETKETRLPD